MNKFRFAIMGAGGIANKFCDAVRLTDNSEIVAIASRSISRAEAFAQKHSIAAAYGSYEEMLQEAKPDCVYIAATTDAHYALTMLCLDYKVPVLCEKAMFTNAAEAEETLNRAKELNVFVMEAMWSRFLPAINQAKAWLAEGKIGKPTLLDFGIGFVAQQDKTNRYFNVALGGGTGYDLTVYGYEISTYFFPQQIERIQAESLWSDTGVDTVNQVSLRFADGVIASIKTTIVGPIEEKLVIYGDKGKIVIPGPHYASEIFLYNEKNELVKQYKDEATQNGFVYQAEEARQCVQAGKLESTTVPHSLTLSCAKLFDLIKENR